ncbi:MAG: quinolinate synthase NadA [Elusimicrobiaceae bacterium]|nr:quinolinate synthase NadA [Elusimicrobiaceae bacterium]
MQKDILSKDNSKYLFDNLTKITNIITGTYFSLEEISNIAEQVNKINELKKENDALILAHYYCSPKILFGVADFCGDSYALAKKAKEAKQKNIIFCGVTFMAETAKILNPNKKVILPPMTAGCSLANGITVDEVLALRKQYPNAKTLCYINSSAEVKAVCDTCVTSGNVFKIVENTKQDQIIFVPDLYMAKNIEFYLKNKGIKKEIIAAGATCCVHDKFTLTQLKEIKAKCPEAKIISHPECLPEVCTNSDFVGSTAGMLKFVKESSAKTFAVFSEWGLINMLEAQNPEKTFLSCGRICASMKRNNLDNIENTLKNLKDLQGVTLNEDLIQKAKQAIDNMFKETENDR